MHMKIGLNVAAAALAVAFAATPAVALEQVTLQLNWFPLADHSPFYLARERGYFEEEGIELEIVRGQGSGDAAIKIDQKQAEFGISDTPTVLTAMSKGADLLIVGMVYDKAANNLFFRKDAGIETPADLVGKKIAAPPGDSHRFLWPSFAEINGIDVDAVTLVNVKPEGKQAIVASDQVAGAFDLYTNYPVWQKVLGEDQVGNMLFADFGVALYGHSYIIHKDLAKEKPDLVKGFLRATYRGWADTYNEREAAIDAIAGEVDGIDKATYLANLDLVLDLVITENSREYGLGWITEERMAGTLELTEKGGTLNVKLDPAAVFTNEFNSKVPAPE
ncbi:ABC transporter substrate-binding protein [Pikeienuella piscinae]|uniref:ABC transporter substrate-binding protein n=1 Tax=Pikeienuella piscinae TaxID=2748098 RepID=A0A7L5BXL6_9RHOB|nr:ABC transporter substrate-binding protein [Pikeienuella piscinae]QIE54996.1 ABC transporter substrate-binding protein [Pikeienuella piscinae]